MTGERWARVKALFQAAVERPVENAAPFWPPRRVTTRRCVIEVESLLAAETTDQSFFVDCRRAGPGRLDRLAGP